MSLMQQFKQTLMIARAMFWMAFISFSALIFVFKVAGERTYDLGDNGLFIKLLLAVAVIQLIVSILLGIRIKKAVTYDVLPKSQTNMLVSGPILLGAFSVSPMIYAVIVHFLGASAAQSLSFYPIAAAGYIIMEIFASQFRGLIAKADPMSDYAQ